MLEKQVLFYRRSLRFPEYRLQKEAGIRAVPDLSAEADLRGGIRCSGAAGTEFQQRELERFCRVSGIPAGNYPVTLKLAPDEAGRRIAVSPSSCLICGENPDELFRAVFEWCDLVRARGIPALPLGERRAELQLKYRLARCPWGPTHRAPRWGDELIDRVDYYPQDFLRELAWDGVNGIWITGTWRELAETSFLPPDPLRKRRIAKLRRTIEKCAPFGIRVWLFCIEPFNLAPDDELIRRFPGLRGAPFFHRYAFCPTGEDGQRYIYESVKSIFRSVPGLGGMLNISHGERGTTCLSSISCQSDDPVDCPRCGKLPKAQILGNALAAMRRGMDDAGARDAGLISWLYMPFSTTRRAPWVWDIPDRMPERTVLQYNFESGGCVRQEGKNRVAGDYHLSFVGPSSGFRRIARRAERAGVPVSAKLQVSSSIEVETLPYVPVPGLLYDKFAALGKCGVSAVMQSWLFGAKPGLMSRAAGLLASEDFSGGRRDFLLKLATPDWRERAETAVRGWEWFSRAYRNFPFCNTFQYYGPLDDGAVWPLYPRLAYKPLTPVWKIDFPLSGDAIGECLENHTLDEAVSLMERCGRLWRRGMACFDRLTPGGTPEQRRQIAVARAMGIQIDIAADILDFYRLRALGTAEAVRAMRGIVVNELALREKLIDCIREDPDFGFQSEAEAYKYDIPSIRRSMASLRKLLVREFPLLEKDPGLIRRPLPEYDSRRGEWCVSKTFRWRLNFDGDLWHFQLENLRPSPNPSFTIAFMDRALVRALKFTRVDRTGIFADRLGVREFSFDGQGGFSLKLPRNAPGFFPGDEWLFGVFRVENAIEDCQVCESSPEPLDPSYVPRLRLKQGYFNPGALFLLRK
ncbi:MAG: hypothetical protein IJU70_14425 [Lentisphaeria bacterium]|nr:hypothetical protein [Lentisphaeria bacterium]